ncbi:GNAT family N-acetyltransferase [Chroococcidiopsis sp. FACHB-1243]|uniref:GNAT family N-acetyltransferase n=1 Tax=Chroococcidiopsis sp. [FACHB-1243] TaxID=2692781 RepID=UPI0017805ED3|nr:GNAT family N-acetyltransferase [Chroococcidiopsis sp. [FACHB-1243]]MBD2308055.1 GNAT family N-acetyltransferase [Chroococcidiopsis sp. [FACHB-1243]]
MIETKILNFEMRFAETDDVSLVLQFIKELAEYEQLAHEVVATEDILKESLFGNRKGAEVILGYYEKQPVSFALFFHNFSTFLGRAGIYLEDLYVKPEMRGRGIGRVMLSYLAHIAKERNCGRLEWWVLDWNETAINFYQKIGAVPMNEWTVFRVTDRSLIDLAQEFAV